MLSAQGIAAGKAQTRHCLAVGSEFGCKLFLGQLVHYRADPTLKDKLAPSTSSLGLDTIQARRASKECYRF